MRAIFLIFIGILSQSVFALPTQKTYNLESSFVLQSCLGPAEPDSWHSYYLGPADENNHCLADSSKNCWEDKQFAVFPASGLKTKAPPPNTLFKAFTICEDMRVENCDILRITITTDPTTAEDQFSFQRSTMRSGVVISSEVNQVPISQVLNKEGRFVLPYNFCQFFEVKYKINYLQTTAVL